MQGVDLVNEEMQGHMESIDDDLTLVSPPGSPNMAAVLQERIEGTFQQDRKRAQGRSRLAQASFPGELTVLSQPGNMPHTDIMIRNQNEGVAATVRI